MYITTDAEFSGYQILKVGEKDWVFNKISEGNRQDEYHPVQVQYKFKKKINIIKHFGQKKLSESKKL